MTYSYPGARKDCCTLLKIRITLSECRGGDGAGGPAVGGGGVGGDSDFTFQITLGDPLVTPSKDISAK